MADAKLDQIDRVEMQEVVIKEDRVTLVLTHEEASVLSSIFAKVGGHPESTYRGVAQGIESALRSVGYSWDRGSGREIYKTIGKNGGGIQFCAKDYDNGYWLS